MGPSQEAEFEEFVRASSADLFRAAYGICRDRQLAEDAVQTALVRAYDRWSTVAATDNPRAYARRIVVNEVLGWRRRSWWGERVDARVEPDPSEGLEETVVETDAMWRALGGLPARQRAVLVLRYYEHLSESQIADVLSIRPGTVKSQASAGLATLRRRMTPATRSNGARA